MAVTFFAAIDVGSYAMELKIFEISQARGMREIDAVRKVIELGRDTYTNGGLSNKIIDEVCTILEGFKKIMKMYRVDEYRACATSAIREAKNTQIILDRIMVRTGIKVDVLSNSEQRFLCYKAIALKENEFKNIIKESTVIVDVGAGSIQISIFDNDALVTTQNLRLGSLRIRETFKKYGFSNNSFSESINELIGNDIATFCRLYLKDREVKNIIATGDYIYYLVKNAFNGQDTDSLTQKDFYRMYDIFYEKCLGNIVYQFDISEEDLKVMLPCIVVYRKMIEATDAKFIWIPGVKLCDGIAADYSEKKNHIKLGHNFEEDIVVAARNISKRYKGNKNHTQFLEKAALDIFEKLKAIHGLSEREKLLLHIAVILHDCGKYISIVNTGDCSYNIIMSTEIIGLSHMERAMVANIVKYNTKDFIYYDDISNEFTRDEYLKIAKLTAILRVVNGIDRSHKQKFKNFKIDISKKELIISTDTLEDITLEQVLFESKAVFFEEVYGIRPMLRRKRSE